MPPFDLLLVNARVLTLDPARPRAEVVGVRGGRVAFVGGREALGWASARRLDCGGGVLIPGFHDAHLHLLGLASRLVGIECRGLSSIAEIREAIARRARETPPGRWLRAWGYHEALLRERRHPTRWDLDQAAPHHPVRLLHRSGHACILNSLALRLVGIGRETPDPPEGVIERDERGEPTGLLLEMEGWLEGRVPPLSEEDLAQGVKKAVGLLLSRGVVGVQDATPANDTERWGLFLRLKAKGLLPLRTTFLPGLRHLRPFVEQGLHFQAERGGLRLGHAKVLLTLTTGSLFPPPEALREMGAEARSLGFPLALHAVEAEAVEAACALLREVGWEGLPLPHRLEHASECPPALVEAVRACGAWVVTSPAVLYHSGDRYLREVPPERQGWLYPIGSLLRAGVPVAFGSDAPVDPPDPFLALYGAVRRRSAGGRVLGAGEAIPLREALERHTLAAARIGGWEGGVIREGAPADLVLVDRDPLVDVDALPSTRVLLTIIGGEVVWEA